MGKHKKVNEHRELRKEPNILVGTQRRFNFCREDRLRNCTEPRQAEPDSTLNQTTSASFQNLTDTVLISNGVRTGLTLSNHFPMVR